MDDLDGYEQPLLGDLPEGAFGARVEPPVLPVDEGTTAAQLVYRGGCSPQCLVSGERRSGCDCRCRGQYHGILAGADVAHAWRRAREHLHLVLQSL